MAAYNRKQNIHMAVDDDEFACPLCCEVFEEPKLLPNCAHNFCKSCLREMLIRNNRTKISCPICRQLSNVPRNGVEGFPTNTLLVRLIDNIAGRKEKKELEKAVVLCKEEIEKKERMYKDIEKQCSAIKRNREHAEGLKKQISTCANEYIETIKKFEKELCNKVDEYSIQNCGLSSQEGLEKVRKQLQGDLDVASAVVNAVEKTLRKDYTMEILEKREMMAAQLKEFSNIPTTSVLEEIGQIKDFDMEFKKCELHMENGLGKVFSKQLCSKENGSASVKQVKYEPATSVSPGRVSKASTPKHTCSDLYQGTVLKHVSLQFQPFAIAVSPCSGDIALLHKERRQVHLFSGNGSHFSTIHIKYGDLWDLAFSVDDDIIVVNRTFNRLLFYTKNGQFVNREVEVPRSCLKFTYLSVDERGRLIITSAKVPDDDDDDDIVNCLIVYQCDNENSDRMFGRRHLQHPVSRAIFFKGKYYVADCCSSEILIQTFNLQGEATGKITLKPAAHVTAKLSLSRDPFSDRFIICCCNNSSSDFVKIVENFVSGATTPTKKLSCPQGFPKQVVAQSKTFFETRGKSTLQVEIYDNKKGFNIVKYPIGI